MAQIYVGFLADAAHLDRPRRHTMRAYGYALAARRIGYAGQRPTHAPRLSLVVR